MLTLPQLCFKKFKTRHGRMVLKESMPFSLPQKRAKEQALRKQITLCKIRRSKNTRAEANARGANTHTCVHTHKNAHTDTHAHTHTRIFVYAISSASPLRAVELNQLAPLLLRCCVCRLKSEWVQVHPIQRPSQSPNRICIVPS